MVLSLIRNAAWPATAAPLPVRSGGNVRWAFFAVAEKIWLKGEHMPRLRHASVACQHCAEPACMEVCPEGAISKGNDGIVRVDGEKCVGCRSCGDACPYAVPQFPDDGEGKMVKCDLCVGRYAMEKEEPPCVATCPTHALKLVKMNREEKKTAEAMMLNLLNSSS